jgi:hypothetical protein
MVNSANSECLLCGALARGHFVPGADCQEFPKKQAFEAQSYRLLQTEDTDLIRLYYYAYADRQIC